jgi:HEAT repeat protein
MQEALASPDHYVRENAANFLGTLGPAAIPALQQAAADRDRRVKRAAIDALGRVGPDAIPALRGLDLGADQGLQEDVERILDRLQGGGGDSKV